MSRTYDNVRRYFDAIRLGSKNAGLNLQDENFVIFSTRLLEKPAVLNIQGKQPILVSSKDSLTSIPRKDTKNKPSASATSATKVNPQALGVQRVLVVNDGQVMVKVKTEGVTSVERLKITDKAPQEIKLRYEVSYAKLPYVLTLNPPLNYQIDPEKSDFNERKKKFSKFDKPIVNLENWQFPGGDKLSFNAAFNFGSGSQSKGVYRLVVDVFPGQFSGTSKPYASPSWWRDWNFGENDPFSVSQTYNLQPFLEGLAETTFGIIEKKPNSAVGRFCFIVLKD